MNWDKVTVGFRWTKGSVSISLSRGLMKVTFFFPFRTGKAMIMAALVLKFETFLVLGWLNKSDLESWLKI